MAADDIDPSGGGDRAGLRQLLSEHGSSSAGGSAKKRTTQGEMYAFEAYGGRFSP
jgi:hypothetical protein